MSVRTSIAVSPEAQPGGATPTKGGEIAAPADLVRETVSGREYSYYPLGQYVVSAPGVCGGRPVFKYTRLEVRYVWEALRQGRSAASMLEPYSGRIPEAALDEARDLAAQHGSDFFDVPFTGATPAR